MLGLPATGGTRRPSRLATRVGPSTCPRPPCDRVVGVALLGQARKPGKTEEPDAAPVVESLAALILGGLWRRVGLSADGSVGACEEKKGANAGARNCAAVDTARSAPRSPVGRRLGHAPSTGRVGA